MSLLESAEPHIDARSKIRSFVMRSGRMTESQQRDYKTLHDCWCIDYNEQSINYSDIFGNSNELIIEIGFGMGHATIELARNNPDKNYLGIEVHKPGVGRVLGEIHVHGLTNLFIIEHDAVEVLESMIKNNSVQGFHIFFPDPWPKKKHHKRRLMKCVFINMLATKLASNGYVYMATDWQAYAEATLEEFSFVPQLINPHKGFAPRQDWRPETRFEKKGKNASRDIYELLLKKT